MSDTSVLSFTHRRTPSTAVTPLLSLFLRFFCSMLFNLTYRISRLHANMPNTNRFSYRPHIHLIMFKHTCLLSVCSALAGVEGGRPGDRMKWNAPRPLRFVCDTTSWCVCSSIRDCWGRGETEPSPALCCLQRSSISQSGLERMRGRIAHKGHTRWGS